MTRRLLAWSALGLISAGLELWSGLVGNWEVFLPSVAACTLAILMLGTGKFLA